MAVKLHVKRMEEIETFEEFMTYYESFRFGVHRLLTLIKLWSYLNNEFFEMHITLMMMSIVPGVLLFQLMIQLKNSLI